MMDDQFYNLGNLSKLMVNYYWISNLESHYVIHLMNVIYPLTNGSYDLNGIFKRPTR